MQGFRFLPILMLAAVLFPNARAQTVVVPPKVAPLIVIGFMGGNVHAGNLVHREAQVAKELQQSYPDALHAAVFANHDWKK
ncbi:MAG TPA: hypothetical protein VF865_07495, partial [Acidobacteriaceae bacterium]